MLPWNRFLGRWETHTTDTRSSLTTQASFFESLMSLRHRSGLGIFVGFFAYDYGWYVFLTWLPSYLKDERKFTTSEMGIYSATPLVAMSLIIVIAGTLSDWLVKRGRNERVVRKAFIIVGLAIGCLIVPAGMVDDKMIPVWPLTTFLFWFWLGSPQNLPMASEVCRRKTC